MQQRKAFRTGYVSRGGEVAGDEEEVENAVSITVLIRRKKVAVLLKRRQAAA